LTKNASEFSVEPDESIKAFDKAIEINPPNSNVLKIKDLSKSAIIIKIEVKWGVLMDCKTSILSTETDPICKMQVDKRKAKFTSEYKRKTYYFCSLFCKKEFDEKFIE
jgi:YHS domain-containing protein